MNLRSILFILCLLLSISKISAAESGYFYLASEPVIRIGLQTNVRYVSITTSDAQLVAVSPDEQPMFLGTTKVSVAARSYRPPEIEIYHFELTNIATQIEAADLAKDASAATGEKTFVAPDLKTNTWRVRLEKAFETIEEANEFKADLSEKGFEAEMITEKFTQPSDEAVTLSKEIAKNSKSEVRSLIKPTGASSPIKNAIDSVIAPNLREVIVSGASAAAKFSSLKSVAFGSVNERSIPVRVNGKAYRGRIEVFVNSRGSLTVVNAVSLEDYLLGVVPNELSLPQMEAQKAQAIAARTYAVANIGQFGTQGFDLLPTVRSQVYKGHSSESKMGTNAVLQTRGIVATYKGKPINALYTSTCGGRTENSENIFEFNEPYLRGVECSLEGHRHFAPFLIKTSRESARIRDEANAELVRTAALFAVNGFVMATPRFDDDYFEDAPSETEIRSWINQLAGRFAKPFPTITKDSAKPIEFARILAQMIYEPNYADTLLSEADINYQLSFLDAGDIPKAARAEMAILLRDGFLAIYPDLTIKPNKPFSRAKLLRLISQIYTKKKWQQSLQSGITKPTADGKLILKSGKSEKQIPINPNVFLFRQFGDTFYQVKEVALVGGENVNFQTNALGEIVYLEVVPTTTTVTAERDSSFTLWNKTLSASAVQSRLSRYVRGIGNLLDVRIAKYGSSRRAIDLEIVGTNGVFHLKGGKIRSALRLNEQLFALNKRYGANGQAISYNFTGRGWGHGVGMCQYGAYGLAKMGVKYDAILKHYYTGIDLTRAY